MKNVIVVLAVVSLIFLSSCEKDRTCTCTVPASGSVSEQKFSYVLEDTKKKKAKNSCEIADDHWKLAGGSCKLEKN